MARKNKIGLQFDGWEAYMAKLDQLGGMSAMKTATEKALTESKKHINPLIEKCVAKNKLPAKGRYSFGDTKESIDKEMRTEWEGFTGSIKVGFDFSKSGLKSIFLMYGTKVHGTPRMKPVTGLKNAIYGSKTQKEIAEIQEKVVSEFIKDFMEG